jgi:hypothetical protein
VRDMRDDHFRRRNPRPAADSRSRAAGAGTGPVAGPDPGPGSSKPVDPVMRWLLVATLACIAGCAALLALGTSDLVTAIGTALGGIAFVLVLAAVFYAVGRSEDKERAEREGRPQT